jgi:lipoate-protein ligase B
MWLGNIEYDAAHSLQIALRDAILAGECEPTLLLLEHDPVITVGRRGDMGDILATAATLSAKGIAQHQAERGGRATYHGPGQLVGYPIAPLRSLAPDVRTYVRRIEAALIRTLARIGVEAEHRECLPGVWVAEAKIASIGIAINRGVCWHGFALNVDPDLDAFRLIRPCGLDAEVTSIARCLGHAPPMQKLATMVTEDLLQVLGPR